MPGSPLITFAAPLLEGTFVRRHKRFSVEAQIGGKLAWVHTNNTGSMQGLLKEGNGILVSESFNPARKMAYTLEFIKSGKVWCGVNTSLPGRVLKAAFLAGELDFTAGYSDIALEQNLPDDLSLQGERSRLDALITGDGKIPIWVECKNVTLVREGVAAFPDAATTRGQKHLRQLIHLKKHGLRAACFFLVQRGDAGCFSPASDIDPEYSRLFWQACDAGVEMSSYFSEYRDGAIRIIGKLPINKK